MTSGPVYADVLFPVAVDAVYTYAVPEALSEQVMPGKRVLAPLGPRKWYAGLIVQVHQNAPSYKLKPIRRVLDHAPIVSAEQLVLWKWTADYYLCSLGEVMKAALPAGLKLDALQTGDEFTDQQWDDLIESAYKPRRESIFYLNQEMLESLQSKLKRSIARVRLMAFCVQYDTPLGFDRRTLLEGSGVNAAVLRDCVKLGLLREEQVEISRLDRSALPGKRIPDLSAGQEQAMKNILEAFEEKSVVLLNGVTSSGKTEIYIHLMERCLKQGKRVLYLVPEIALTAQLIQRLKAVFGHQVGIYHSRFSDEERVEVYLAQSGTGSIPPFPILLGVRSSIFLPYENLGLVIVDEEHENSYKQADPAPRYNARDMSIVLAARCGAKVLLGSATPAVESYYNALNGKYALVELGERYGGISLPHIELVDMRQARKDQATSAHFSHRLLQAIRETVARGEQVILFQNRRGYSPYLECPTCGYVPSCTACNVKLTYHKNDRRLVCHYCGQTHPAVYTCPHCKITSMELKGYGTERIEEELMEQMPHLRIARMDLDTTRSRDAFQKIVSDFENRQLDVLIGTQMITKGLDFSGLSLVGVLNADNLLNYPDFRSGERSFQLLSQVAGRAGRRSQRGQVLIQTSMPAHSILQQVLLQEYPQFYKVQSEERSDFLYPPFTRLVRLTLKHRQDTVLDDFAYTLGADLRAHLPAFVLGPERPVIDKIQHYFLRCFLIKIPREVSLSSAKSLLKSRLFHYLSQDRYKSVKMVLDVDPL